MRDSVQDAAQNLMRQIQEDLEASLLCCMAAGVPASNIEVRYKAPQMSVLGDYYGYAYITFIGGIL